ncbi:MAG: hypothetical protein GX423_13095 [Nitrospiraceae bacterium]|jgi:uncharacterized membrane protein (DUF373 family)|nr:hypothetical protein [Nitrospiraceae bacterium]
MEWFKKIADLIVKLLIPVVIITLLLGMVRLFVDFGHILGSTPLSTGFDMMVTNILSMFVVVELLRSVIDYFEYHRLKITFITDAALVFILREIMIGIYQHKISPAEIGALAGLLLAIGAIRTLAIIFSPDRRKD